MQEDEDYEKEDEGKHDDDEDDPRDQQDLDLSDYELTDDEFDDEEDEEFDGRRHFPMFFPPRSSVCSLYFCSAGLWRRFPDPGVCYSMCCPFDWTIDLSY